MFNVLVTADIHIHDYLQNNFEPDFRLNQFKTLGSWFTDVIVGHGCKAVIIAGDFFNVPSPRPKVVEVGAEFLSLIASYAPVFITHGQHDIDVREKPETFQNNTLLKTIQRIDKKRLQYLHKEEIILNSKIIYFHGYDNDYPENNKCDIYVTHAFMKEAIMPGNPHPISKGVVIESSPLVIAGDIHKHQTYKNVLIPGPPIQNSFKDDPNTGIIILNLDTLEYHRLPSGYVKGKQVYDFMTFTYEECLPEKENQLHITKLLPQKTEENVASLKSEIVTELNPLKILEDNISDDLKDIHVETISALSPSIFPSLSFKLKSIELQNFLHFEKLFVDFSNFGKFVLVIGENGSGKTSFFKSILYALKGGNGREYSLNNKPLQVSLKLEYENSTYEINRSWSKNDSGNVLKFKVNAESQDFSGINAGNELLYGHLPFIQYLDLIDMNQQRVGFLSTYTLSNRIGLLNKICNIEIIDLISKKLDNRISPIEKEIKEIETILKTQETLREEASKILTEEEITPEKEGKSKEELLQARGIIAAQRRELIDKRLRLQRQKDEHTFKESEITKLINQYISDSRKLEEELKAIIDNTCPVCNQKISETLTIKLRNDKKTLIAECNRKMQEALIHLSKLKEITVPTNDIIACETESNELEKQINIIINKLSRIEADAERKEARRKAEETLNLIEKRIIDQKKSLSKKEQEINLLKKYLGLVVPGGIVMNLLLTKLSEKVSSDFIRVKVYKELVKKGEKRPDFTLEMFNEKYNSWVKYDKLSGGERTVADIWWLSKLYDLTNGVGIVLLDETFKFLDKENLEKCVEIVKNMNYNNCFVVSHKELFPDYDSLLKFDKAKLEIL